MAKYWFDIKGSGGWQDSGAVNFRVEADGFDQAVKLARIEAGKNFSVAPHRVWIVRGGEMEASVVRPTPEWRQGNNMWLVEYEGGHAMFRDEQEAKNYAATKVAKS